jgi:O-antigen ligase
LYAAVFFVAIMSTSTLFPFIVGKYVWFRVSVDLALIAFLLGLIFDPEADQVFTKLKQVFRSPLTWAVSAFALAVLLAVLFGYNANYSFWSNFERGEGGLQMLHLYTFFLLLITLFKEEKNWRTIFWCSLIGAGLMILYGVGAGIGLKSFIGSTFSTAGFRFSGSIGNPAYVATYLIFILFFTSYLWAAKYLKNWKNWKSLLLIFAALVFVVFFLWAATRGAVIGVLAALVVALVYLGLNRPRLRRWTMGLAIIGVILFVSMVGLKNTKFVQSLGPVARIFDISVTTKTFQDRSDIWKMAWDGWKARPIFGWGPENFLQVFDRYFNPSYFHPDQGFGAWFDRAHSFIFDYLAETGILGLLGYLSMFAIFYYLFFKNRSRGGQNLENIILDDLFFILPIAYLIQALVLFDVLVIYVNLFLFMAFAVYYFRHKAEELKA